MIDKEEETRILWCWAHRVMNWEKMAFKQVDGVEDPIIETT